MLRVGIIKLIIRLISRKAASENYIFMRHNLEKIADRFIKIPGSCTRIKVDVDGIPGEWISSDKSEHGRVILYLHGGGYVIGSPKTHRELVYRIARASGARVLSLDYRLAPENPFPAAVDDALSAYSWLLNTGIDPARISIMGDSAGGGLTLVLLQKIRDLNLPSPACAICLSPFADLSCSGTTMESREKRDPMLDKEQLLGYSRLYACNRDLKNPEISPLFGNFSDLPPILIQVGSEEVLLDDSRRIYKKSVKTNTDVTLEIFPGMFHVWQLTSSFLPQGKNAINKISSFIKMHIPSYQNESTKREEEITVATEMAFAVK